MSLFSSPSILKCAQDMVIERIISEIQEPTTKTIPNNIIYIIIIWGFLEILYNPLTIGLSNGALLKFITATHTPIVPNKKRTVPIINSIEPI